MSLLGRITEWLIPAAQAHEKWFVSASQAHPPAPALFRTITPTAIAAASAVFVIFVAAFFLDRVYERSRWYAATESRLRPFRDLATGVLAVSMGFSLVWFAMHGQLLAPNLLIPDGIAGLLITAIEAIVGVLLMIGILSIASAGGLLGLYVASFVLYPAVDAIDYIHILGIGIFLLVFARGRYSLDWFLGKPILSTPDQRKWAYLALRLLTGFALLWLGLWKFIRPDLHFALMDKFPDFNPYVILGWMGVHMSREIYVFCLAVVETSIGFAVMTGLFTRIAAVMLTPIMCISVIFLGAEEMVGHLPIVGALCVFFVYGDTYHKHDDSP